MRCWAGWTAVVGVVGGVVAGVVVLAACGGPAGGGTPATPSTGSSTPAGGCAAGHAEVTVVPGGAVEQQLCVRPGTVVTLTLRPRTDDRRWTAVHSSAPVLVLASGWRVDADGTGHASLRCAGVRAGVAEVTALAKAPDVAGAARAAFRLRISVVPYAKEG
ncbi:hypothetical protein ACFXJ5_07125 [Streptomyces sp. NPDC059373]